MLRPRIPLWLLLEATAWFAVFAFLLGGLWQREWSGMEWIRDAVGIERLEFPIKRD